VPLPFPSGRASRLAPSEGPPYRVSAYRPAAHTFLRIASSCARGATRTRADSVLPRAPPIGRRPSAVNPRFRQPPVTPTRLQSYVGFAGYAFVMVLSRQFERQDVLAGRSLAMPRPSSSRRRASASAFARFLRSFRAPRTMSAPTR